MSGGYEDGYKDCNCFWGRNPGSYVQLLLKIVSSIQGLTAIDLGCGEGKNSHYLAQNGAEVIAIDVSKKAIENALSSYPKNPLIQFINADVLTYEFEKYKYDIFVTYGLFHCLKNIDEVKRLYKKINDSSKSTSYIAFCSFNERKQELTAHPNFSPILLKHEDYLDIFSENWNFILENDSDLIETHPNNNILHTHSLTRFIAKRKKND